MHVILLLTISSTDWKYKYQPSAQKNLLFFLAKFAHSLGLCLDIISSGKPPQTAPLYPQSYFQLC